MKTNKITLLTLITLVTGCINISLEKPQKQPNSSVDAHHTTQSFDWAGTYFGILPCASCPGISTLITLDKEGNFEKTIDYLSSHKTLQTVTGKFTKTKDNPAIISLDRHYYLIKKNQLLLLSDKKQIITGVLAKDFILNKTELEPEPDSNDGYSLKQFSGSDKKKYSIVFNTNPKIPTALVQSNHFKRMLTQTQVWAKGAEYESGDIKLIVRANTATLILNHKKIILTRKD